MPDNAHNLISVALLLEVGEVRALFGSDLEEGTDRTTGWAGILANRECPDLPASLVKVSHHGAMSGFHDDAWRRLSRKERPLSVVTPFVHGSLRIPTGEELEALKQVSNGLALTGHVEMDHDLQNYYPRKVVQAVRNRVRSMQVVKFPEKLGFFRARFLPDGTRTEERVETPARWVVLPPDRPAVCGLPS